MIFFIMGKTASGKNSIFEKLVSDNSLSLSPVILYTTRPKRPGEAEGVEYYFISKEEVCAFEAARRVIEKRVYSTKFGPWVYMTVDDENLKKIKKGEGDHIVIGTLDAYISYRNYFGKDNITPIYIDADRKVREDRSLKRICGKRSEDKNILDEKVYRQEVLRRLEADDKDYADEKLEAENINLRFDNSGNLDDTVEKIKKVIESFK